MTDVIVIDVTAAASLNGDNSPEVAIEAAALAVIAMDPSLEPEDGEPGDWLRLTNPDHSRMVEITCGTAGV